jgi:hypothetical protein
MLLELPEPLEDTNLRQFHSSRKRAITGQEAAEEEQDQAWRRCREEINTAVLVVAEDAIKARQKKLEEEAILVASSWLESQNVNIQGAHLQIEGCSQLTDLDSDKSESSDSFLLLDKILSDDNKDDDNKDNEENSSSSNSNNKPRRSSCIRKVSRIVTLQLSQDRVLAQQKAVAKAEREAVKGKEKGKGIRRRRDKLKLVLQLLDELDYIL